MADETKTTFPAFPAKHWWALREKFKRSAPPIVTSDYLEAALNINKASAVALVPNLRAVGIIDAEGKVTDRAFRWRDDSTYPDVCEEIRNEIYPAELLHAVPNPTQDRTGAERWFARKTGAGEKRVKAIAALYQLLAEADVSKAQDTTTAAPKAPKVLKPASRGKGVIPGLKSDGAGNNKNSTTSNVSVPPSSEPATAAVSSRPLPSIHIDIQIHIASDATLEQIDQIFASMAKHLYRHAE